MKIETIGVADLKRSLKSASDYLSLNTDILDNLNVFPVPDGDTGINMLSTLKPAVDALLAGAGRSEMHGKLIERAQALLAEHMAAAP